MDGICIIWQMRMLLTASGHLKLGFNGKRFNRFTIDLDNLWNLYWRAKAPDALGIHVSDNVIVGRWYNFTRQFYRSKYGEHCLDSEIDFGNIRGLCGNQYDAGLLTPCNGPFRAYLQWNHPRRARLLVHWVLHRDKDREWWMVARRGKTTSASSSRMCWIRNRNRYEIVMKALGAVCWK